MLRRGLLYQNKHDIAKHQQVHYAGNMHLQMWICKCRFFFSNHICDPLENALLDTSSAAYHTVCCIFCMTCLFYPVNNDRKLQSIWESLLICCFNLFVFIYFLSRPYVLILVKKVIYQNKTQEKKPLRRLNTNIYFWLCSK